MLPLSTGKVTAFDIDEKNELHKLYVAKVCQALGLVRTYDGFRTPESVSQKVEDLTARILRSMPSHKPEPPGEK